MPTNHPRWSDQWPIEQRQLARKRVREAVRQPCEACNAPHSVSHHEMSSGSARSVTPDGTWNLIQGSCLGGKRREENPDPAKSIGNALGRAQQADQLRDIHYG